MPKASELMTAAPNILCVGDAGSGKTSAVMTLGAGLEILDIDGNVRTALHCGDGWDEARQQVEVCELAETNLESRPDAFDRIQKKVSQIVRDSTRGRYPYRAVAVDSLSTLAETALVWAQAANGNLGQQPEQREWGTMARAVESLINQLKSIPIATFIIAHDTIEQINGESEVRLGVPGQALRKSLPKKFSDIWYFRTRVGAGSRQIFEIHTRPRGAFRARSSANLPSPLDASEGLVGVLERMGYPWREDGGRKEGTVSTEAADRTD